MKKSRYSEAQIMSILLQSESGIPYNDPHKLDRYLRYV